MAGATAFFTTFALTPLMIILIQVIGLFYNLKIIKNGIFNLLASVLGKEGSTEIRKIFNQFHHLAGNWLVAAVGFIFLLFITTTLFSVVRKSVNEIWNIKIKRDAGVAFDVKLRIRSLLVIFFAAVLLVIQLAVSALQAVLRNYTHELWNEYSSLFYKIISQFVFIIIATIWFTVLFRYLANARPHWKVAFTGGAFTGILFTAGKMILGVLLSFSNLRTIFGASASFVLILLFVFYSSFIFYYGAAFTKALADIKHKKLVLEEHAYEYDVKEVKRR